MEVYQEYGNDLAISATGDLLTVDGVELSIQRVVRRLLTNIYDYYWRPTYGAGLPSFVGQQNSPAIYNQIKGLIVSNMLAESSVSQSPAPIVELSGLPNKLIALITYTVVFVNKQVVVNFSIPSNQVSFTVS